MKLSTRGRYATRALLDVALHQDIGAVTLKGIAQRQNISVQYLERLVGPLIRNGILRSIRGAKGGILLAKAPEEIKLGDIIHLLEGSVAPSACVDNPEICERSPYCVTRDVWEEMKDAMEKILQSTTLKDLVERQKQKEKRREKMYYI
ncbi:RrF2 family transcriptional regulator [Chloroflexota bacterium]